MMNRKLENDRKALLEKVLYPSLVTLFRKQKNETDKQRLNAIDAEMDRVFTKIDEIIDMQIEELTDDILSDPDVQKDMEEIRKGTREAKKASEEVRQEIDKLTAVKKAVDKTTRPIEQLGKLFS